MSGRRVGLLVNYLMGEYTNNIGAGIGIGIGNHESTNETISEIIFDIVISIQVQIRIQQVSTFFSSLQIDVSAFYHNLMHGNFLKGLCPNTFTIFCPLTGTFDDFTFTYHTISPKNSCTPLLGQKPNSKEFNRRMEKSFQTIFKSITFGKRTKGLTRPKSCRKRVGMWMCVIEAPHLGSTRLFMFRFSYNIEAKNN